MRLSCGQDFGDAHERRDGVDLEDLEPESAPEWNMQDSLAKKHFSQPLANNYIRGMERSAGINCFVSLLDLWRSHESIE